MARKGINKHQIVKAAKEIAATGVVPTATKVRVVLKTGSITTIQKYLQAWKQHCFNNINLIEDGISIDHHKQDDSLVEKLRITEQALNKQITQNE